jgi:hypothetical protein
MSAGDGTKQVSLNEIFEPQSTDTDSGRDDLDSRVFSIKPPGNKDGSENNEEK